MFRLGLVIGTLGGIIIMSLFAAARGDGDDR